MIRRRTCFLVGMAILFTISIGFGFYALFTAWHLKPHLSTAREMSIPSVQKKPVRGSFNVQEGKLVYKVLPKYPALTQEMKLATVGLNLTIDEAGKVIDVAVTAGYPVCSEAAKQAVFQWRYTPTLINRTEPVVVQIHVNLPCGDPQGRLPLQSHN